MAQKFASGGRVGVSGELSLCNWSATGSGGGRAGGGCVEAWDDGTGRGCGIDMGWTHELCGSSQRPFCAACRRASISPCTMSQSWPNTTVSEQCACIETPAPASRAAVRAEHVPRGTLPRHAFCGTRVYPSASQEPAPRLVPTGALRNTGKGLCATE